MRVLCRIHRTSQHQPALQGARSGVEELDSVGAVHCQERAVTETDERRGEIRIYKSAMRRGGIIGREDEAKTRFPVLRHTCYTELLIHLHVLGRNRARIDVFRLREAENFADSIPHDNKPRLDKPHEKVHDDDSQRAALQPTKNHSSVAPSKWGYPEYPILIHCSAFTGLVDIRPQKQVRLQQI